MAIDRKSSRIRAIAALAVRPTARRRRTARAFTGRRPHATFVKIIFH